MASQMIGERYTLNFILNHELILTVQHLLADRGLMLNPEHANTALCRSLIHPA